MSTDENDPTPPEKNSLLSQVAQIKERASRRRRPESSSSQVMLPLWDDSARGLPNSLARGALFTAVKSSSDTRSYYQKKKVASLGGISIEYRGEELRQDDSSVFMTLLHFGRGLPLGAPIPFTAYGLLKELGWSINSVEYQHLRDCCERLSATNVSLALDNGKEGYAGSLIRSFRWRDEGGAQLSNWEVYLEPEIVKLFTENSYTLLEWEGRKKIGGRAPLALWLHAFLSTHYEPYPIKVSTYMELSCSQAKDMNDFRRRLKVALNRLIEIGFLEYFSIKDGVVHVKRVDRRLRLPPGNA